MAVSKKNDKQKNLTLNAKKTILTILMIMSYGWNYLGANNTIFEKEIYSNKAFANTLPVNSGNIILPIEVLGAEGIVVSRSFTLDQVTVNATKNIWFMINNLSYENKASIRINNGTWLSLNHLTVVMQKQEKQRGGMTHGGFNTVRLTIPKTGLVAGSNTIEFRFNKSDGISIGYRVVRMNLLGTNDIQLLPSTMFEEENPDNWTPPFSDQISIDKGKDLWENANLWNHYLSAGENGSWYGQKLPATRAIKAKCASCHTQDGRDLEMFSYSNFSIIERAKFHKLTEQQGKEIASYIRSLSAGKPNVGRYGRPWNPPYQPGSALKIKPINQWAAGAGIDAVLEEDKDMAPYLFPNGVTKEGVRDAFDSDKMDDRTILPLAIQFPDWKHWLPMIHPIDAYTKNNYIEDPNRLQKPLKAIKNLRTYMQAQPPNTRNKIQLLNEIRNLWLPFRRFFEEGSADLEHWRTEDGSANMNLGVDIPREFAATSLARLLAVKNFELNVEFDLQNKASWFVKPEDQPSGRQWPNNVYSVFEVPAHFQACVDNNCQQFKGQSTATGQYETTAWYHLQYVLNGGNGFVGGTVPTDFNYHAPFIAYASASSGIPEPLRYYSSLNQMYQIRSWSGSVAGPGAKGFRIRNQGPFHFLGIHQTSNFYYNPPEKWLHFLDDVKPGLSLWVLEAQLLQFLKEMQKPENNLSTWPRLAPNGGDEALDPITKSTVVDITINTNKDFAQYADKMYYIIPKFKAEGVDCSIMNELIDWCQEAWPLIDFEKFKNVCSVAQPLPVRLISFSGKNTEFGNELIWKTDYEKNFKHFEIERSSQIAIGKGIVRENFEKIGTQASNEHGYYKYLDQMPPKEVAGIYRLKMIDFDGRFVFSKNILIENKSDKIKIGYFYPNPTSGEASIDFESNENGLWYIKVYDLAGRIIYTENKYLEKGYNKIEVKNLNQGLNLVRIENTNFGIFRKIIRN